MDDTGSMGDEIEAVKSMAIDIVNYDRQAPIISYILSPFNDPYPSGKSQIDNWANRVSPMLKCLWNEKLRYWKQANLKGL